MNTALTNAARTQAVTVMSAEGQSQIQSLLLRLNRLADPVQEDGRLALTAPIPADANRQIGTAIAHLDRALSTPCHSSAINQAAIRMSSMPMPPETAIGGELRLSILKDALSDVEMNGVIPDEIIIQVAREFASGKHGKWFPSAGEFVTVCRERVKPLQRQLWELRRLQSAQVKPPVPEAERQRQISRVQALMAGFAKPTTREAAE